MKKSSKQKVKDRRKVGIVKAYMSRASAVKKLQIPLADFRRLCILKGVYPVEPKNKSKLTGGNTRRKTYFFTRDIQYLMNDPLLYKFWEFKVFMKRLTKAKGRHDLEKFNQVNENKPFYKLDAVVKERYPRFVDALRDCDDALSMCFLFSMFPKGKGRPDEIIDLSKSLTEDFMEYIIASKTLRKVFISIKGYYYQAEIMNQTITWMVPHQFVIDRVTDVDLSVMKTFTEFYITLLGFINYKLKKSLKTETSEQQIPDLFEEFDYKDGAKTVQQNLALERLFSGLKFFLNREVPKDSIAFVIRCFGGEVSWNGDSFPECDVNITHHIVDRDSLAERRPDRVYIQPQWVYDSVNMRQLLSCNDYFMGAKLPPHLSPFVTEKKIEPAPSSEASKTEKINKSTTKSKMTVKKSKLIIEDKEKVKRDEEAENRRLGIMMIPKKKKRLFDKITRTQKERAAKERKLVSKREIVNAVIAQEKARPKIIKRI